MSSSADPHEQLARFTVPASTSIFAAIAGEPPGTSTDRFYSCLAALQLEGLTGETADMRVSDAAFVRFQQTVQALSCSRAVRRTAPEMERLKKSAKPLIAPTVDRERLWQEHRRPRQAVLMLDLARLPADAMAFYRPFHYEPFDEWGIYLDLDELFAYGERLYSQMSGKLASFSLETLLSCVLFEVFQHEFFHHIVECAATTLEVFALSTSQPRAVYRDYRQEEYIRTKGVGNHWHAPLEEALANAYAYNALSFLSRVKVGCRTTLIRLYQEAIQRHWRLEPAGYCEAAHYISGSYIAGSAQLLAMLLNSPLCPPAAGMLISQQTLLNGNSAYFAKPDIPTYLVGSPEVREKFLGLVPAPTETYCQLFWPGETDALDAYLRQKRAEEKAQKHPQKPSST